jgi:hypothetical protein
MHAKANARQALGVVLFGLLLAVAGTSDLVLYGPVWP